MKIEFAHLQVHTKYSFGQSAVLMKELVKRAAASGMRSIAKTDMDFMFGNWAFHKLCNEHDVKPILGVRLSGTSLAHNGSALTLLAASNTGYANVCHLLGQSDQHTEQHYRSGRRYYPPDFRAFFPAVPSPCDDIFALAGPDSEIGHFVRTGDSASAAQRAGQLLERFGRDHFFIALADHRLPGQRELAEKMADLADHVGVGVVAVNDVRYLSRSDYADYRMLSYLVKSSARRIGDQHYLKSAGEMQRLFDWRPDAIANSVVIADCCNVEFPSPEIIRPPVYVGDCLGKLRQRCEAVLTNYGDNPATRQRLDRELALIAKQDVAYRLLWWSDAVAVAKNHGHFIDPSAEYLHGYLSAYLLGLTPIDPMAADLELGPEALDFHIDEAESVPAIYKTLAAHFGKKSIAGVCSFPNLAGMHHRRLAAYVNLPEALGQSIEFDKYYMDTMELHLAKDQDLNNQARKESILQRYIQSYHLAEQYFDKVQWHSDSNHLLLVGNRIAEIAVFTPNEIQPENPLPKKNPPPPVELSPDDVEALNIPTLTILDLSHEYNPPLTALRDQLKTTQGIELSAAVPLNDKVAYEKWLEQNSRSDDEFDRRLATLIQPQAFHELILFYVVRYLERDKKSVRKFGEPPIPEEDEERRWWRIENLAFRLHEKRETGEHRSSDYFLADSANCLFFRQQLRTQMRDLFGIELENLTCLAGLRFPSWQEWQTIIETNALQREPEYRERYAKNARKTVRAYESYFPFVEDKREWAEYAYRDYRMAYYEAHFPEEWNRTITCPD